MNTQEAEDKGVDQETTPAHIEAIARRHVRAGWIGLLVFLVLGFVLEMLHGFKVSGYLAVGNETRRLLWVLAHAHGALISILNIVFALTLTRFADESRNYGWISNCLVAALVLMPLGFFTGGVVIYGGDPGAGIFMAIAGALLLIAATWGIVRRLK